MGHLRLLWRLLRFATFELPVCLLIATLIWTIIDNLTLTTDRLSVLLVAGGLAGSVAGRTDPFLSRQRDCCPSQPGTLG